METEITITRELVNDIIFYFSLKSSFYERQIMKCFEEWLIPLPENDEQLKTAISVQNNDRIELLLLKINP
jgi:hypothetical protein